MVNKNKGSAPKVAILKSMYKNIDEQVEKLIGLTGYKPVKKQIFIKPNIVDAVAPGKAVTTSPQVIEAVIKYFLKHYPEKKIIVGDGMAGTSYYSREEVLKATGLSYLEKKYSMKIINLHDLPAAGRTAYAWKYGTLKLPRLLADSDFINLPKMKTHVTTGVSLGMKNLKGLLVAEAQKSFHNKLRGKNQMVDLEDAIRELSRVVRLHFPVFTITDGIVSLEGDGPADTGTPRKTDLLVASTDLYAHDHVAARLMGFDPETIRHIPAVRKKIEIVGDDFNGCVAPHAAPNQFAIPLFNVNIFTDKDTCSRGAIPFKIAFEDKMFLMKVLLHGGFFGVINIIFGRLTGARPDADDENYLVFKGVRMSARSSIAFCSCTKKVADRFGLFFVSGCPPEPASIQEKYIEFLVNRKMFFLKKMISGAAGFFKVFMK
jgi:uncharacterized protein (DUF362 family)